MNGHLGTYDIEVYDVRKNSWAQAKFLVHGYDAILWTDSAEAAAAFIKESIERAIADK